MGHSNQISILVFLLFLVLIHQSRGESKEGWGCEDQEIKMDCDSQSRVEVIKATFEFATTEKCKGVGDGIPDCSRDVTKTVSDKCGDTRSTCSLLVKNENLGGDPCENVQKQLHVSWRCRKGKSSSTEDSPSKPPGKSRGGSTTNSPQISSTRLPTISATVSNGGNSVPKVWTKSTRQTTRKPSSETKSKSKTTSKPADSLGLRLPNTHQLIWWANVGVLFIWKYYNGCTS